MVAVQMPQVLEGNEGQGSESEDISSHYSANSDNYHCGDQE